jgi:serine/threonine-protein kinase
MGNLVGTPAYMAPEMTEGRADARTDVFLSGAVLHEVLTGEPRTMGKGLFDTLMKAANPTPYDYPEHLPPQLVAICRKATAPDPDDRYQTVRELQEALADWLRHRGAEELANEAQRRLDAARAGDDNAGELLIEAHFGFTTALREWPDHEGAQRGLEQCQVERVRRALDDGQLQLAEALLAKVGEPSEQLEEEVAALREAYARQAELHARAKQLDFTVSARERAVFVVVMLSLAVFLWGLRFVYGETPVVGPRDVAYPACGLAVLGMGAAVYWKKLVRNQVSQQWLLTLLGTVFAWLVCRLLGWWHELHISVVMSFDLLVLGLGAGLFALWTARWIAPGLLFNAAAIVAIALAPEWHLYAFLFAFVGSMSWIGVGWMRGWGREPGAA